jgi:predicted DCC family thiol-disulfide oxidoreductase YuxK
MISTAYLNKSIFFFSSLFAVYLLVRFVPIIQLQVERFGKHLILRGFVSNADNEYYKFAILRIVFGLILLVRAINIQWLLLPEERFGLVGLFSALDVIAAVMVTVGLLTQLALVFFMLVMWHIGELILGTSTLGNDIAAMLGLLLLLTSSGRYISIDSWILRQRKGWHRFLCYSAKPTDPLTIAIAKFTTLFCYWLVCLYSLFMHINEPAWTSGVTGPLLFTNNFMSAWSASFEAIFLASDFATFAARVSIWLMMLWYAATLPLVLLGGLWKNYVIVWGLLFFTLSLTVLNLGSLAEIEFVLWAGLFWVTLGLNSRSKLLLFYDDKCNLCDKTVQIITTLDVFNQVWLMPISSSAAELEKYKINIEDALSDLYGVDEKTGKTRSGYFLYCWLALRIVLLWPVAPIFLIGLVLGIGPFLYRKIAVRRRKLFGICELARTVVVRGEHNSMFDYARPNIWVTTIFIHVSLLGAIYCFSIPAPYLGVQGIRNSAVDSAQFYGITPIDVFNMRDMRLAENWFTIRSNDSDIYLPIFTQDGERLMFHKSDRIYFGNTLRFRRGEIGNEDCAFERHEQSIKYLAKVWLNQRSAVAGAYNFEYTQYHMPLPDTSELIKNHYIPVKKAIRCQNDFRVWVK